MLSVHAHRGDGWNTIVGFPKNCIARKIEARELGEVCPFQLV